jgi:Tfp pilus assembly protein PilX
MEPGLMPPPHARADGCRGAQQGVIVLVALVAILVMALSATALLRSVDTSVAVAGNLGFMQAAQSAADDAVERAVAALFEQRLVVDPSTDDPANGYFASRQPAENTRGVPAALQSLANYPGDAPVRDAGNGNTVRYVIERMCLAGGGATADHCLLAPTSEPPLATPGETLVEPPLVPVFRQSIRVDGPANATQFVQAWLADIPGRRRLAWRALAD